MKRVLRANKKDRRSFLFLLNSDDLRQWTLPESAAHDTGNESDTVCEKQAFIELFAQKHLIGDEQKLMLDNASQLAQVRVLDSFADDVSPELMPLVTKCRVEFVAFCNNPDDTLAREVEERGAILMQQLGDATAGAVTDCITQYPISESDIHKISDFEDLIARIKITGEDNRNLKLLFEQAQESQNEILIVDTEYGPWIIVGDAGENIQQHADKIHKIASLQGQIRLDRMHTQYTKTHPYAQQVGVATNTLVTSGESSDEGLMTNGVIAQVREGDTALSFDLNARHFCFQDTNIEGIICIDGSNDLNVVNTMYDTKWEISEEQTEVDPKEILWASDENGQKAQQYIKRNSNALPENISECTDEAVLSQHIEQILRNRSLREEMGEPKIEQSVRNAFVSMKDKGLIGPALGEYLMRTQREFVFETLFESDSEEMLFTPPWLNLDFPAESLPILFKKYLYDQNRATVFQIIMQKGFEPTVDDLQLVINQGIEPDLKEFFIGNFLAAFEILQSEPENINAFLDIVIDEKGGINGDVNGNVSSEILDWIDEPNLDTISDHKLSQKIFCAVGNELCTRDRMHAPNNFMNTVFESSKPDLENPDHVGFVVKHWEKGFKYFFSASEIEMLEPVFQLQSAFQNESKIEVTDQNIRYLSHENIAKIMRGETSVSFTPEIAKKITLKSLGNVSNLTSGITHVVRFATDNDIALSDLQLESVLCRLLPKQWELFLHLLENPEFPVSRPFVSEIAEVFVSNPMLFYKTEAQVISNLEFAEEQKMTCRKNILNLTDLFYKSVVLQNLMDCESPLFDSQEYLDLCVPLIESRPALIPVLASLVSKTPKLFISQELRKQLNSWYLANVSHNIQYYDDVHVLVSDVFDEQGISEELRQMIAKLPKLPVSTDYTQLFGVLSGAGVEVPEQVMRDIVKNITKRSEMQVLALHYDVFGVFLDDEEINKIAQYIIIQKPQYLADLTTFPMPEKYQDLLDVLEDIRHSDCRDLSNIQHKLISFLAEHHPDGCMEEYQSLKQVLTSPYVPLSMKRVSLFQVMFPEKILRPILRQRDTSPLLEEADYETIKQTALADLIRIDFQSSNREFKEFVTQLSLVLPALAKVENSENLSDIETSELCEFFGTDDVSHFGEYLEFLKQQFNSPEAPIGSMFCDVFLEPMGFESVEDIARHFEFKAGKVTEQNIEFAENFTGMIPEGAILKGTPAEFLEDNILSGFRSNEYVDSSKQTTDRTPMGADFIQLTRDMGVDELVNTSEASTYGEIFVGMIPDENFQKTYEDSSESDVASNQYEMYRTGVYDSPGNYDHIDIRTGLGADHVRFIAVKNSISNNFERLSLLKFQITKTERYIPVYDGNGKLIFDEPEFEALKSDLAYKLSSDEISELNSGIANPDILPEELLNCVQGSHEGVWGADVGLNEGFDLRQHTLMVLGQLQKVNPEATNLLKFAVALHDIGKYKSAKINDNTLQHKFTSVLTQNILDQLKLPKKEQKIILALIKTDPLGQLITSPGKPGNIQETTQLMSQLAVEAGMGNQKVEFFEMLLDYYTADASSYTVLADFVDGPGRVDPNAAQNNAFDLEASEITFTQRNLDLLDQVRSGLEGDD